MFFAGEGSKKLIEKGKVLPKLGKTGKIERTRRILEKNIYCGAAIRGGIGGFA